MTTLAASYAPRRNTTSRRASVFGAAQTWPATVIGPRAASPLSTSRRSKRMVISLPRPALVHELRRREQQRVPVLRRDRLVERRLGGAAEPLVKTREIEAVLQKRKRRQFCCIRLR